MSQTAPKAETMERVREMIRRDLMLGPDAVIEDDTPLFEGDFDLDSLDALLLVTSLEKEFDIKIPNEQIGQEIFADVITLATYVENQGQ